MQNLPELLSGTSSWSGKCGDEDHVLSTFRDTGAPGFEPLCVYLVLISVINLLKHLLLRFSGLNHLLQEVGGRVLRGVQRLGLRF